MNESEPPKILKPSPLESFLISILFGSVFPGDLPGDLAGDLVGVFAAVEGSGARVAGVLALVSFTSTKEEYGKLTNQIFMVQCRSRSLESLMIRGLLRWNLLPGTIARALEWN